MPTVPTKTRRNSCPVTELIHSTWTYEQRPSRDSTVSQIRLVLKVTNERLLRQYDDQQHTQPFTNTTFPADIQHLILTANTGDIECGSQETHLLETCLDKKPNEVYLFHGTSLECVTSIIGGFDLRKAKPGLYGEAIYLAESSEKADQYTDKINNRRKTGLAMLLVKVKLGHIQCFKGTPPVTMSYTDGNPDFDTVVTGFDKRFREFLVFDQKKTYPAFVVIYDRID